MSSTCPACQRLNPPQARYCFYDGVTLAGATSTGPIRVGSRPFLTPFVFPSGRSCKNFDELVRACEDEWAAARDMLRQGFFVGFFGGLGRADLAQAAREAARDPDLDRALDEFLSRLPGERTPPQLTVNPRDVNLGQIDPAQPRAFVLALANQGAGLLGGTARSQSPWLMLGDAAGVVEKHFSCRGEFSLPVQVKVANLRAGSKPQEGQIVVQAGYDVVTVVVRASRPVVPFAHGKFAGATTPRRLAELARDNPREAAPLFASGQVARWYESNGWTYPVQGPPAAGLGAVQQYFEALGLAKPPRVRISAERVELAGAPGGSVEHFLFVESDEKRAVFARALSEADWLEVVAVKYQSNSARIHVRVPSVPLLPGQRLTGKLTVISNGNQRFDVEVALQIQGRVPQTTTPQAPPPQATPRSSHQPPPVRRAGPPPIEILSAPVAVRVLDLPPIEEVEEVQVAPLPIDPGPPVLEPLTPPPEPRRPEPPPVAAFAPEPVEAPRYSAGPSLREDEDEAAPRRGGGRLLLHLVGPALIALVLLGAMLHDWLLPSVIGSVDDEPIDPTPLLTLRFHDGDNPDALKAPANSMSFGVAVRSANNAGKRLTFDDLGRTNNVCVKIDGEEYLFGYPDVIVQPDAGPRRTEKVVGSWIEPKAPLGKTKAGRVREGARCVWRIVGQRGDVGIDVTQTVELVPGEQSMRLDTVLVRYTLHNRGSKSRSVGIRFLLDTYIGDNDGVPFTIPGEAGLCSTRRRFDSPQEVPDYIQALENESLLKPGTVAHLQLRTSGELEAPSRVLLGGYPDAPLSQVGHRHARGWYTGWDVPFVNVRELLEQQRRLPEPPPRIPEPDSAVTLYWDPRPLGAGEKRDVGFSYGLGEVASGDSQGKLLLTVGGRTVRGGEFSLTALRAEPQPNERLTLRLPAVARDSAERAPSLELLSAAEQEVPPVARGSARPISTVTWRLKATRTGTFPLVVESSADVRQSQKVRISAPRAGVLD